eukprot:CAMPEP_0179410184 /NCGR_PEP_ID=MMETSP0799-20121207/3139_1 /TAXON_ID=46947 /ORGANISM="Geminigera cryophila, Strain CCMP2564" /LENGTH=208 /DNA_ID=CAMNT_0021181991 /DNA_START=1 /DNA_END=623 /DNA_ORIENTATION=-
MHTHSVRESEYAARELGAMQARGEKADAHAIVYSLAVAAPLAGEVTCALEVERSKGGRVEGGKVHTGEGMLQHHRIMLQHQTATLQSVTRPYQEHDHQQRYAQHHQTAALKEGMAQAYHAHSMTRPHQKHHEHDAHQEHHAQPHAIAPRLKPLAGMPPSYAMTNTPSHGRTPATPSRGLHGVVGRSTGSSPALLPVNRSLHGAVTTAR